MVVKFLKMHIDYLRYIMRHKRLVFIEAMKLGIPFRGLLHDMSKFLPSEYFPYMNHFYGPNAEAYRHGLEDPAFDKAWMKHIHRNPHHWEHWVMIDDNRTRCMEMNGLALLELIADYRGMANSVKGASSARDYYLSHKDKMQLHPDTRESLEIILGVYPRSF